MGNSPLSAIQTRNPKQAFELGLALAKEVDADLVLATDPDADRTGRVREGSAGESITL